MSFSGIGYALVARIRAAADAEDHGERPEEADRQPRVDREHQARRARHRCALPHPPPAGAPMPVSIVSRSGALALVIVHSARIVQCDRDDRRLCEHPCRSRAGGGRGRSLLSPPSHLFHNPSCLIVFVVVLVFVGVGIVSWRLSLNLLSDYP